MVELGFNKYKIKQNVDPHLKNITIFIAFLYIYIIADFVLKSQWTQLFYHLFIY